MSQDDELPVDGLMDGKPDEPVGDGGAEQSSPADPHPDSDERRSHETHAPAMEAEAPTAPESLYFMTNRMNLNGVLSSRIVAPREAHAKYYADLLEQTPGWVPLLTRPPSSRLIDMVTAERGAGAPVLIEFPLDVVKRVAPRDSVVFVPAVALARARAIHLREERDLREHRARGYKNVHPHDDLLEVTPELFAGTTSEEPLVEPPPPTRPADWRRIDRIRGAVSAAVASVQNGEQLAAAAAFLGQTRFPAVISMPEWVNLREIDDNDDSVANREAPDSGAPDHVGFRAAYDVMGDLEATDSWTPNTVLDAVATSVQASSLTQDASDAVVRNLQRVRAIVNVEADFEPFRPTARALVSAKSLLLVLLRPDLEELLAWPQEETGADDLTRVTAAVLAGRLRGLAREATTVRSLALDDMTAEWAVRVARGKPGRFGKVQFTANSRGTTLKLDGVELAASNALIPDPVAKYTKLAAARKEATRIRVSHVMGWPITHRIALPEGAALETDESAITITTPAELSLVAEVEEEGFVNRLAALSGDRRRQAVEAFTTRRRTTR